MFWRSSWVNAENHLYNTVNFAQDWAGRAIAQIRRDESEIGELQRLCEQKSRAAKNEAWVCSEREQNCRQQEVHVWDTMNAATRRTIECKTHETREIAEMEAKLLMSSETVEWQQRVLDRY